MAQDKYAIGSSVETLTELWDLIEAVPQGMAIVPHSVLRHTLSGRSFGDGYPQTQWYFDYLPSADYNTLMNYISGVQSGYVYIKTRLEDGTYGTYRAIMHRPETRNEKEAESYGWRRITIKFTRLEAVT